MFSRSQLTHLYQRRAQLLRDYSHVNWALMDQGVISGVNFITGILLARFLGIVEFGVFTIAWLVIEFLQSMQYSLIIAPMMSIAPKQSEDERPVYMGAVIVHQLFFSVAAFAVLILSMLTIGFFVPDWEFLNLMWPLAIAVIICPLQNYARRYLFVIGRSGAAFFVDVVRYGGQLAVLGVLFLNVKMGAGLTLWAVSGCAAIAALLSLRFLGDIEWKVSAVRESLPRQWAFSKWLLSSEVMRWATGNLFMIASGAMIGAAAVGAIKGAANLVAICHIITHGLSNIVPVSAARKFGAGGRAALVAYLKRFTAFGGLAIGTILLVAAAAPNLWLELIYGADYAGYGYLVQWWAVVYFLAFLTLPPMFGLRAMERTKSIFWAQLAGAGVSVVLIYPLITAFGIVGVMMGNLSIVSARLAVLLRYFFHELRQQK